MQIKKRAGRHFFSGPTKQTFLHNSQYPISDKCRFIVCGPEKNVDHSVLLILHVSPFINNPISNKCQFVSLDQKQMLAGLYFHFFTLVSCPTSTSVGLYFFRPEKC